MIPQNAELLELWSWGRQTLPLFQIYNPSIFFPLYPDLESEMARHLRAEWLLRKGKGMMSMKRSLCEGDS